MKIKLHQNSIRLNFGIEPEPVPHSPFDLFLRIAKEADAIKYIQKEDIKIGDIICGNFAQESGNQISRYQVLKRKDDILLVCDCLNYSYDSDGTSRIYNVFEFAPNNNKIFLYKCIEDFYYNGKKLQKDMVNINTTEFINKWEINK